MNKIFCFINSGKGTNFQGVYAIAEDGVILASHISSSEAWARHDIGLDSDWKHEIYEKHYPNGYKLVWVDNPRAHEGLSKANELNRKLGDKGVKEENMAGVSVTIEDDEGNEHTITKTA